MSSAERQVNGEWPSIMNLAMAAKYLRRCEKTMRKLLSQIPHRQVGRMYFISRDALDRWTQGRGAEAGISDEVGSEVGSLSTSSVVDSGVYQVVAAWPTLSAAARAAVLEIVRSRKSEPAGQADCSAAECVRPPSRSRRLVDAGSPACPAGLPRQPRDVRRGHGLVRVPRSAASPSAAEGKS